MYVLELFLIPRTTVVAELELFYQVYVHNVGLYPQNGGGKTKNR